jgi:hypothetical protein
MEHEDDYNQAAGMTQVVEHFLSKPQDPEFKSQYCQKLSKREIIIT